MLVALRMGVDGEKNPELTAFASMGTGVQKAAMTLPFDPPQPTRIQSGNENTDKPEALYWWGGLVNTTEALSDGAVITHLQSLSIMQAPP